MRLKLRPAVVLLVGTSTALLLALLVAWAWNSRVSNVHWGLAAQVRQAARTDISFLGEAGGRAPSANKRVAHSYAMTIVLVWAMFALVLAGHGVVRAAREEPIFARQGWGLVATTGFVITLTLTWAAVTVT